MARRISCSAAWLVVVTGVLGLAPLGCDGCSTRIRGERPADAGAPLDEDGGRRLADAGPPDVVAPEPEPVVDAGPPDAGLDLDAGLDAGASDLDAGTPEPAEDDAGPFDWRDLFGDAGVPEALECLPGTLPDLSLQGILQSLELSPYTGSSEPGVWCGDELCEPGVPCCELCSFNQCAQIDPDAGTVQCPLFTRVITCDGREDCPGGQNANTCCYTLGGTDCRAEEACAIELPRFVDGGIILPDPPSEPDAGPDGGVDMGGFLGGIFDQGAPVCRNTLFDCNVFDLEVCCTSERFVSIDLGVCLPALVCVGGQFP